MSAVNFAAAFLSDGVAAPASEKDRDEVVKQSQMGQMAVLIQDYRNAEAFCAGAKTIAARFDPDDFLLGQVEICYAHIAWRQNRSADACAGYLRAENHFNVAGKTRPALVESHLDQVRGYRKTAGCR
jgi:hypothetical protein